MAKYQSNGKRDIHAEVTASIIEILESGTAPWRKEWKETGHFDAGMPHNPFTGRAYHGVNVLITWAAAGCKGYRSQAWATYKQIQDAGGQVRAGQKATCVTYFKKGTYKSTGDDGIEEKHGYFMVKPYAVFNLEQCDGVKVPTVKELPEHERLENAESYLTAIPSDVRHGGSRAFFSTASDYIQLPPAGAFRSIESYYATSLHEHVHWTGAESRLDRIKKRSGYGSQAYAFEELCAELGSAFICAELGIDSGLENHASYLDSWLEVLKGNKKAIFQAAAYANAAREYLNDYQGKAVEDAADMAA